MLGEMNVLDETGDLKIMWDSSNDDEVEAAREQFDNLTRRGYLAFSVKKSGEKNVQIRAFDASLEKIILVPKVVGG